MTATLAIIQVDSAAGGLDINAFAAACRLHPDLVRRFVALGLLSPRTDRAGRLWFRPGHGRANPTSTRRFRSQLRRDRSRA